jgi:hypothetical protein
MSEFTVKTHKTKYGYRTTVYEDGQFYAQCDAPTREEAESYAGHYVMMGLEES